MKVVTLRRIAMHFVMLDAAVLLLPGRSDTQRTTSIISPTASGVILVGSAVDANGTLSAEDFNNPLTRMRFGIQSAQNEIQADPNDAGGPFSIADLGAPFGFPSQWIVWTGTRKPNANGWVTSPMVPVGTGRFLKADHLVYIGNPDVVVNTGLFIVQ